MEVDKEDFHRQEPLPTHNLHTESECGSEKARSAIEPLQCGTSVEVEKPVITKELDNLHTNPSDLYEVPLSPSNPKGKTLKSVEALFAPSLNGEADAFWQIVNDHPGDLPAQLANELYSATGRNITGAQVKALIDAGPPKNESDHEPLPW